MTAARKCCRQIRYPEAGNDGAQKPRAMIMAIGGLFRGYFLQIDFVLRNFLNLRKNITAPL
jgi:hypothetical protein